MNTLSKFTSNKNLPMFKNPFRKDKIYSIHIHSFDDICFGHVELKDGLSELKQEFKDKSFDKVLTDMKTFIDAL